MRWTWADIEGALGPIGTIADAVSAVVVEAGDPPVSINTLYVWRSRGIPRSMRWALAEALRRAGHAPSFGDLERLLYKPTDPAGESFETGRIGDGVEHHALKMPHSPPSAQDIENAKDIAVAERDELAHRGAA